MCSQYFNSPGARLAEFFLYFINKILSLIFVLHHIILMGALCWYYLDTLLAKAHKNGSSVCSTCKSGQKTQKNPYCNAFESSPSYLLQYAADNPQVILVILPLSLLNNISQVQ